MFEKLTYDIKISRTINIGGSKRMSTKIQAKANLIWEVATKLVGVYKPHEYGKVILPMTVLKRFDDIFSIPNATSTQKGLEKS